jgi:hypothetical protein
MRILGILAAATVLTAAAPAPESKTYTGFITDTMCNREHASMKISPDAKCVRDCVGNGSTYQYALMTADAIYRLSDQETPAKLAARRVIVTGVLYTKTNILKVESIKPVR